MSSTARSSAMSRHPALNRMPRDFVSKGTPAPLIYPDILKGDAQ